MILNTINICDDLKVYIGKIPVELITEACFNEIWNIHPDSFNKIKMYEKDVYIPRWQQAYGKDYYFSNQVSQALPVPEILEQYLTWSKSLNQNFNGLLLNWYDSDLKHYIGRHKDSESSLILNSQILTISLGAKRIFRLRHSATKMLKDIEVNNGDVLIIPWNTNKKVTHEVPYLVKYPGKRISITIRAFSEEK